MIGAGITQPAADLNKLGPSVYSVDREATLVYKANLENLFGDILPVRLVGGSLFFTLTQKIVHLMGMENMLMALYDYPDEMHTLCRRITDDYLAYYRFLECENMLLPTNSFGFLGAGSWGFTTQLPGPAAKDYVNFDPAPNVAIHDCWGFMDSQETIKIPLSRKIV